MSLTVKLCKVKIILEIMKKCFIWLNRSCITLHTHLPSLPELALNVCCRMEEVNFRRFSTIAKSLGTIVSISGAFIVTFYNGPAILNTPLTSVSFTKLPLPQNWVLGGFLCACSALAVAAWCILQV